MHLSLNWGWHFRARTQLSANTKQTQCCFSARITGRSPPWGSLVKTLPKPITPSPASLTNLPTTPLQRQCVPLCSGHVSHRQRRQHEAHARGTSPAGTLLRDGQSACVTLLSWALPPHCVLLSPLCPAAARGVQHPSPPGTG